MDAKLGNITFDCNDVLRVATFWSEVLVRPIDQGGSAYFAPIGGRDPERRTPAWYFARVPEPKPGKNRVHVDITTPDPAAVERLVALGATVVAERAVPGASHHWTVMTESRRQRVLYRLEEFYGLGLGR